MQRREFLRQLASGLLVAAVPAVIVPTRKVFRMGVALAEANVGLPPAWTLDPGIVVSYNYWHLLNYDGTWTVEVRHMREQITCTM